MTYIEFSIPFVFQDERGERGVPRRMFISINLTGEMAQKYAPENWEKYPPSSEDACRTLAENLENNLQKFLNNDYIHSVSYDGETTEKSIRSIDDLERLQEDIYFIY
jgi:hypothetical protein